MLELAALGVELAGAPGPAFGVEAGSADRGAVLGLADGGALGAGLAEAVGGVLADHRGRSALSDHVRFPPDVLSLFVPLSRYAPAVQP